MILCGFLEVAIFIGVMGLLVKHFPGLTKYKFFRRFAKTNKINLGEVI